MEHKFIRKLFLRHHCHHQSAGLQEFRKTIRLFPANSPMLRLTFLLFLSPVLLSAQTEREISFYSDSLELYGTLSLPPGDGPFPLLITVHGSGPNDRDGTIPITDVPAMQCLYPNLVGDTIRTLADIAEYLQTQGIATLRYDKRTYTYTGSLTVEFSDFIADGIAAVDFARSLPEVDQDAIFLFGHSQGSDILPYIALERSGLAGLVVLGGPYKSIGSLLPDQIEFIQEHCFQDTVLGPFLAEQMRSNFARIQAGEYPEDQLFQGGTPAFWKEWMNAHDRIVEAYRSTELPMLFIHGIRDYNVPPEDLQQFGLDLEDTNFTDLPLPEVNHFGTEMDDPNVSSDLLHRLGEWINWVINHK